jgi:hypothetical protein
VVLSASRIYYAEHRLGVQQLLTGLREELRTGSYRPLPVRERRIPKRGGKLRRLGIGASCTTSLRMPSA